MLVGWPEGGPGRYQPARHRHPGAGLPCPPVRRRVSLGSSHAASV